jgi:hypothetical protein
LPGHRTRRLLAVEAFLRKTRPLSAFRPRPRR